MPTKMDKIAVAMAHMSTSSVKQSQIIAPFTIKLSPQFVEVKESALTDLAEHVVNIGRRFASLLDL
jgi:hypothetical protein